MKQPEKQVCRVCKVEIERTAEARGADWALCPLHLGMVTADERERRAVKEIADMLLLGRLMIARDAARAGWVTPVPPTAPKRIRFCTMTTARRAIATRRVHMASRYGPRSTPSWAAAIRG